MTQKIEDFQIKCTRSNKKALIKFFLELTPINKQQIIDETEPDDYYYGFLENMFGANKKPYCNNIITLEQAIELYGKKEELTFPREMMVSDDNKRLEKQMVVHLE